MALDTAQIKQLLGTGLSNEVVASAVGCEPSYITQLMSEDSFREEVIMLRTKNLTANNRRDGSIDSLEDKLIDKVHELVDRNMIYKPMELSRLMVAVNNMKRRGVPAHANLALQQTVINLNIPQQIVRDFVTNPVGEVIEVTTERGKQTLTTMPAHQLLRQLAKEATSDEVRSRYSELQRFLPVSSEAGSGEVAILGPQQGKQSFAGLSKHIQPEERTSVQR